MTTVWRVWMWFLLWLEERLIVDPPTPDWTVEELQEMRRDLDAERYLRMICKNQTPGRHALR